jgi:lysyl-tRNA synthetase, class I
VSKFPAEEPARQLENPGWHIHSGKVPAARSDLSYNILLNLAGVANAESKDVLWGFITRYAPEANPTTAPFLDRLVRYAINYYQDFVKPTKRYRAPNEAERAALTELRDELGRLPPEAKAEEIQFQVYEIGKRHGFADLKSWFQALYEVLLGQTQGPRMGSFIELYGIENTRELIAQALERSPEPQPAA